MEFKILGPLEVYDSSGNALRIPTGHERALLVVLVLRAGKVVSTDTLIDALWGETPPSTAAKAVQGYVSHLRRQLDANSGETESVLATQSPGYVLRVTEANVDALQFERLAAAGRRALEDRAPAEALATLDSALALWRGAPIPEFAFDDFAQRDINRLTELHLAVCEDRFDALLELGRHGGLVSELEAAVDAHPHRERLRGQLMLALYRAGRQADALQVYKDGSRLARELGLDPSPELRALEHAILDQDPSVAAPTPAPLPTSVGAVASEQGLPDDGPRRSRWRWLIVVVVALAALAVIGAVALTRIAGSADTVAVVPPAVVVVDPNTNRVVESIPVGSRPITIAAGEGAVWVGDARDGTVTRIDPATLLTKAIGIGAPAIDAAAGAGSVWVATGGFGTIVRVDAELGTVVDRIELGAPGDPIVPAASSVAAGTEGVWVGAFDGLVRIDPRSGREVARVDLGSTPALQVGLGGGAVWSTTTASRAKRVEARSGDVTAEFYAGVFLFPIAVANDGVWIGGPQVWKVDPVTGSQELSTNVGSFVTGIAVGADAVWVAAPEIGALVRLDAETGQVLATIPVGGAPEEVVIADGRVWATVLPEETGN